jgi:hypothetical protein
MPEWQELVKLENELRERAILDHISVPLDDPNRAVTTAYWKGRIDAIVNIWTTRDLVRKQPRKGGKNAYNEEQEDDE